MVEIYELGMMIQQIRDNDYRPEFYFFLVGDFWDEAFKKSSPYYQWCLIYLKIDMEELFSHGTQGEKMRWLQ